MSSDIEFENELIKKDSEKYKKLLKIKDYEVWQSTNVMQLYYKKYLNLLEKYKNLHEMGQAYKAERDGAFRSESRPGYQTLYVVLFQVDSDNMLRWEIVLKAIKTVNTGRPIFNNEAAAQKATVEQGNLKMGYAAIWVSEVDVIQTQSALAMKDAFGNQIVVLQPNALKASNIRYFVHGNGKKYDYIDYKLVPSAE
ncbi:MAG: type IVB secretion system protein IcmQ [Pseudomonadota bacterium]|nr:type IVB secretion system protein IcmQ [Pseudomonadota bacterium]